MKKVDGILNDFNKHTNIQSGVDPNRLWTTQILLVIYGCKWWSQHLVCPMDIYPTYWTDVITGQGINALNTSY